MGTPDQGTSYAPLDLYRYASGGPNCSGITTPPGYTSSSAAVACYSIDGGLTNFNGIQFNQAGGGSDYGDFAQPTDSVQDAFYSGPDAVYSSTSPEFGMMESIGYDAAAPEPATWTMAAAGLSLMLVALRRSRADRLRQQSTGINDPRR